MAERDGLRAALSSCLEHGAGVLIVEEPDAGALSWPGIASGLEGGVFLALPPNEVFEAADRKSLSERLGWGK
jgi:hypothetical protein